MAANTQKSKGRAKFHIKTGDTVFVVAGKEKGKSGKVIKLFREKNRAIVEKLNMVKRHEKASQQNPTGGIIEKEAPIHISNLMAYDPSEGGPVKIGRKVLGSGEKVRYSKKSGEEIV